MYVIATNNSEDFQCILKKFVVSSSILCYYIHSRLYLPPPTTIPLPLTDRVMTDEL